MQKVEQKKDWVLTSGAFNKLLSWLDEGTHSSGEKYLEIRERLVSYFDRKNCTSPDELADETLNRVARRLEEEGKIEGDTPARYCYIVARFVFLESLRGAKKEEMPIDDLLREPSGEKFIAKEESGETEEREKMLDCLEHCTEKLEPQNREIIVGYYLGEQRVKIENRRTLAEKIGVTMNALSIRACRIRDKLEACVGNCAKSG